MGVGLYGINFPTTDVGYAVGWGIEGSAIQKSTDGGSTWGVQQQPGVLLFAAHFIDKDTGLVAGYLNACQCGMIAKTTDGGQHWATAVAEGSFGFYSMSFVGRDTGFLCGYDGFIMKTVDRGDNWRKVKTGTSDVFRRIYMVNSRTGYATAGLGKSFDQPGQIFKTTDGGEQWNRIQDFSGTKVIADIWFTSPDVGFFVGSDGHETIYRTADGGVTWESVFTGGSDDVLQGVLFASPSTGYAVGTNSRILHTIDGGTTWLPEHLPQNPEPLVGLATNGGSVFATGLEGTIVRRTPALAVRTDAAPNGDGVTIAPNPMLTTATVAVNGARGGEPYTFTLFDIAGAEIRKESGAIDGDHFTIARAGLAPGTYLYRLLTPVGGLQSGTLVVR